MAIVGATNITAMRTAGGHSAVQAACLSNPAPEVLSVIGCGAQARAEIRGFLTQFPSLKRIRLFGRSRGPMERVKREFFLRAEVVNCTSPEEAVTGSGLVLMASRAQTTLVTADVVAPGTTVIGMEGFRDLDPALGRKADKWYLGYRKPDAYIQKSPRLNPGGLLGEADVFSDMTGLLPGRVPDRERENEIIISTHMGMGAHDVSYAATVDERALKQGKGQKFRLDTFSVR